MDSVNKRQSQWKYAIIAGIINIVIGVLLVVFKKDSLNVILIISGVLLIVGGVVNLIGGFMEKNAIPMIVGGVATALGIAMVILPNLFSDILMVLLAVLFIILGILSAASVFNKEDNDLFVMIFSGVIAVIMIVAGVIILCNLNTAANWVMLAVGIIMIAAGILNVVAGLLEYNKMRVAN